MSRIFLAHAGHSHEDIVPWWQDATSVTLVALAVFVAILLLAHYLFKAKLAAKLVVVMAYLLSVGVLCYSVAPVLSIAALSVGFGLALTFTLLQLVNKKQPPEK